MSDSNSYYDFEDGGPRGREEKKEQFWKGLSLGLAVAAAAALILTVMNVQTALQARKIRDLYNEKLQEVSSAAPGEEGDRDQKIRLLEEYIDTYYYKSEEVTESLRSEGIYKGLVEALKDPYSVYYTAEDYAALGSELAGAYSGIGAYIGMDPDTGAPMITGVFRDSPAIEAGLDNGDYFIEVDGTDVSDKSTEEVAALVRVNNSLVVQRGAMFPDELVHGVEDEVHPEAQADLVSEDFMGEGVEYGGEIALVVAEEQVGDIGQQDLSGSLPEITIEHIGRYVAGGQGLGHAAVGVGLADLAAEAELAHQAADLLDVHDDARLMQQTHVDASGALVVAAKAVGIEDQVEIAAIRVLPGLAGIRGGAPVVVTRPGNAGDAAQRADLQEVVVAQRGLADDGEFHLWRSLDSHDFRASKSAV